MEFRGKGVDVKGFRLVIFEKVEGIRQLGIGNFSGFPAELHDQLHGQGGDVGDGAFGLLLEEPVKLLENGENGIEIAEPHDTFRKDAGGGEQRQMELTTDAEDDFAAILLNFEFLGFSGGDQTEFTGFHLQPGIVELEGHGAFEHQFEGGHGLVELEKFVSARKDGGVDDIFGPQGDGVVSAVVPRFGVHVERDPFPEDFRLRLKIHSMNASL